MRMVVTGVKPGGTERLGLARLLGWGPQVVSVPQFPHVCREKSRFFSVSRV